MVDAKYFRSVAADKGYLTMVVHLKKYNYAYSTKVSDSYGIQEVVSRLKHEGFEVDFLSSELVISWLNPTNNTGLANTLKKRADFSHYFGILRRIKGASKIGKCSTYYSNMSERVHKRLVSKGFKVDTRNQTISW